MKFKIYYFLLLSIALFSCNKKEEVINPTNEVTVGGQTDQIIEADSVPATVEEAKKIDYPVFVKPEIGFTQLVFPKDKKDSVMKIFNDNYNADERAAILALNRLDSKNKGRADTLVIPAKIDTTLMSYTPFPTQLEILKDVRKFVVFSYPLQAYGVYANGVLLKWGPTSMGKKSAQTKRGLMFTNWKKKLAISTVDSEWKLPYNFNIENHLGIGWHQYDLPGFPASHSCLRLLMKDAQWMYAFGEQWVLTEGGAKVRAKGIPVIVFGDYGWGKSKPWFALAKDSHANDISVEQMDGIIRPHLQAMLDAQAERDRVLKEVEQEKLMKQDTIKVNPSV